jgi:hypothetical protein
MIVLPLTFCSEHREFRRRQSRIISVAGQSVARGYMSERNSKEETVPHGRGLASEVVEKTAETRESRGATSN